MSKAICTTETSHVCGVEDREMPPEPIALVGSSCRFAGGATSPSKLWEVLADPTDLSRPVPANRFSTTGFFHKDPEYHGTTNSPYGYWLSQDVDKFDAAFFNISRKEAESMDPQQRLLLEVVYEALESAGYTLKTMAGRNVGVYTGVMTTDYRSLSERDDLNASQYAATGNASSIIANRISYFYNFNGPSMTVDTACSSSLVALHQAVLGLRSGETSMACVAGANLMLTPEQFISESDLHMLSPTGHCQMWDAKADGYARGEGVVTVLIKTLSRALADGDSIQAIIRHTGVNSDGRTQGLTVPNSLAQSALIQQTYKTSGLDPFNSDHRPQYFEAHGDPREARAIAEAFFGDAEGNVPASTESEHDKLLVGSVKTIIGHTEGAAGLAGILKVMLAMQNDSIPRNMHFDSLSPGVLPFYHNLRIPTQTFDWPSPPQGQPMRASVNSFGFGGTNGHAILEKYQPEIHNAEARIASPTVDDLSSLNISTTGWSQNKEVALPLLITAASEESFTSNLKYLASYIRENPHLTTQELAWHLYKHRTAHSLKAFVVSEPGKVPLLMPNLRALIERATKASPIQSGAVIRSKKGSVPPRVLGIFTGQGAQYTAMSKGLLFTSAVYLDTIRRLDQILQNDCPDPPEWTLEEKIKADGGSPGVSTAALAQPLCTAVQIALVELLASINVSFSCVVGHSSGEIAAAFAAQRLSMREAILIAYYRGRFAYLASGNGGSKGGMMACGMSKQEAEHFCSMPEYQGRIGVAASNSPSLVTLSGDFDAITAATQTLKAEGKLATILKVDTAYHSFHMVKSVQEYSKALSQCAIQARPPPDDAAPRWVSSVYGHVVDIPAEDLAINYWKENMLQPVLFHEALGAALSSFGPFDCAIEVGPHPQLKTPATETIKSRMTGELQVPYHGLLQRGKDAEVAFAEFLGFMCTNFDTSAVDIRSFVQQSSQPDLIDSRLVGTPTYAWDHTQRYWRESRLSSQYHFRDQPPHELLGVRTRDDNQFQMRWRNLLKMEQIPWVEGHKFQGQALLPASAYCIMALDAARFALNGRKASIIELQELKFLSGVTLEAGSLGVEILFTLSILPAQQSQSDNANIIQADITLTSVPVASSKPGPMKKNFEGRVVMVLDEPYSYALPPQFEGSLAETAPVNIGSFYQMMEGIGLSYTGPFQALESIDRRLNYARGFLRKVHPSDTTGLDMSPAFLDSCFQATFATFSSPGDRALWTSFLPTKIGRMRFNLALYDTQQSSDKMNVECHLTKFDHYSFGSAATITADLSIYNEIGQTAVQLEELVVSSFSAAKPKDDYELYLHTVLDLDPEYGIVTRRNQPEFIRKHIKESCDRVAQFYIKDSTSNSSPDTPPDSPRSYSAATIANDAHTAIEQDMETFMSNSPYHQALKLICSPLVSGLSQSDPHGLPRVYKSIVDSAYVMEQLRTHLGRVVQQISHRFPRMDVLDLTLAEWNFTENILDGLHGLFSSYELVASEQPHNLLDRCPDLHNNNKVSFIDLDFDVVEDEMDVDDSVGAYDLVILSTAVFSRFNSSQADIIRRTRKLMRMRGFLVIVDALPVSILERRVGLDQGRSNQSSSDVWTPFDATKSLPNDMFLPKAENSTQAFSSGLSITVRQADGEIPTPMDSKSSEAILLVGPDQSIIVGSRLSDFCEEHGFLPDWDILPPVGEIEAVTPDVASKATVVLMLSDLTKPVCTNMTEGDLNSLKSLMQPGKTILWVTTGAQSNPETAASLGLTRTLKAENPNLILQVLNFYETDRNTVGTIIDRLMLLIQYRDHLQTAENLRERMLFTLEPEIHFHGLDRGVPRVLPYKPAIERLNSSRREVSRTYNSLETCLSISSATGNDGLTRFDVGRSEEPTAGLPGQAETEVVDVEFTSLYPLLTSGQLQLHLAVGLHAGTRRPVAALTPYASSKVKVSHSVELKVGDQVDRRVLASWLAPMITAATIGGMARPGHIVFIEPHPMFLHCAREVLGAQGFTIHALTSDTELARDHADVKYLHPLSNGPQLMRLIPRTRPTVVNFLPEDKDLSKLIRSLASHFEYEQWPPSSTARSARGSATAGVELAKSMVECINLIGPNPLASHSSSFATPTSLHGMSELQLAFTIVDWTPERYVPVPVRALVEPRLLKPDKTYILVGMTRDFGQSVCRLFIQHGARNIVVASRSKPNGISNWIAELNSEGANIQARQCDAADLDSVRALRKSLGNVGGIVNGAMVLDDRIFAQMDIETWTRVMRPKALGSSNLDKVFNQKDLEFFIMTSSFAAIGGHAGQSNYAAANMFMNGLAANRRQRGLAGSVLNIGVIYGIGLLAREARDQVYHSLEREGYPPISERDIQHMFLEAIVAGRPVPGQIIDLTTGLARYRVSDPNPLHWHRDARFCHFTVDDEDTDEGGGVQQGDGTVENLKQLVESAESAEAVAGLLAQHLCANLQVILQLPQGGVTADSVIIELGVDSLMAVEIRNWFYKKAGSDVPVMKILQPQSISELCLDIANKIVSDRG
ncbi:beta-ketoacyl synthase domain-containing protein [Diaporthe helianthi]|uniref:Beta-ketoacyl synthase domain-containing protein n=1 Tax=Diaporthe helianthi TaxID=158607 RepID=A0A1C1XN30_DIAHE|nr:polyketide synthase 1 [Diaporthe helianthi]POS79347.1 beta-ketoacyl synthase domain-containing protein [Diaporthe helianthi]